MSLIKQKSVNIYTDFTPNYLLELIHRFWPQGIDCDIASDERFNGKLQAKNHWSVSNPFHFNGTDYLGDTIWCHPPDTLEACSRFSDYIARGKKHNIFKEALLLVPTSIDNKHLLAVLEADEVFFASDRLYFSNEEGELVRANSGYCLAYYSSVGLDRVDELELLLVPYFWKY